MRTLIYFLFLILSFSVYAEDSPIILDPFQGPSSTEGEIIEIGNKGELSGDDFVPAPTKKQAYIRECSLTAAENGFSESCLLKDVGYQVEQHCPSEKENDEGSNDGVNCPLELVTEDEIDETELLQYPLERFLEQSSYFKRCSVLVYEDGNHSEYCISFDEIKDDNKNEDSSEDSYVSEEQTGDAEYTTNETNQKEIIVPESVEKAIGGVGKVIVQFGHIDQGIGSGFFIKDINDQPVFITNYHVFGAVLQMLFSLSANKKDWFLEDSNILFYVQQGDQKFRIKGVRDMSLIMDLAVLEVENYTGDTLSLADHGANEELAYVLGYPEGNNLKRIKVAHPFLGIELHTSFMVSDVGECYTLKGVSGGPALNSKGKVVGVAFSIKSLMGCIDLRLIPVEGLISNIDLMSSLKTNKGDIADLIKEQELLFYNQLLSNSELRGDMMVRASFYLDNRMFFSDFLNSTEQDYLLSIDQKLSESEPELSEEDRRELQFLVQKNIAVTQGLDIESAAQLGNIDAKFSLGEKLYNRRQFGKSYQLFQELVQLKIPFHLYMLSEIYYGEENVSQACRLLTYAEETIKSLEDLYQEYECDSVLNAL